MEFTHRIEDSYTSLVSLEDARQKIREKLAQQMQKEFDTLGQEFANKKDECIQPQTFEATDTLEKSGEFSKKCQENETTKPVTFKHSITETMVSTVSLEDAKIKLKERLEKRMQAEFADLGQKFAEQNGVCIPKKVEPKPTPPSNGNNGGG